MTHRMWGGRFVEPPDPQVLAFTSSFAIDRRLLHWDALASIAHAQMLGATGIIPAEDARRITDGLQAILRDVSSGQITPSGEFEDVHTFLEAALYERIGPGAGRLHTARSRNDQVITALRLYVKSEMVSLVAAIRDLMEAIVATARSTAEVVMPGFTHLQHAQPVRLAHHLLAYAWMLNRDADRCVACFRRADVLPLGSGALAGVNFPIDRARVAQALGFAGISENSIDATGDRDFVVDAVHAVAMMMVHLSRWAGELILWATDEFGFVRFSEAVAHGSSIMPQKKNPDAAELIRARSSRVIGDLSAILILLKGLPSGYSLDLQEDKGLLFDALDTGGAALRAMHRVLHGLEFVPERMAAALSRGWLTATEVADYLVRKGMPFRDAHALAGRVVQQAAAADVPLWELPYMEYQRISPLFEPDILDAVTVEASIEAKGAPGGTAARAVERQLRAIGHRLQDLAQWMETAGVSLRTAERLAEG